MDGWYRRVIRQSRGDHDDDDKGELDHSEEDSDQTICDELTPHSQIPTKGNNNLENLEIAQAECSKVCMRFKSIIKPLIPSDKI